MADSQSRRKGPEVRPGPMITAAALGGAGVMLALAGLAVGTAHLLAATRRWMRELEVPPSELAKLKWAQAKAAAAAGSDAWQKVPVNQRARSVV
jgi:hypothetical protein